jgi:hypothetical protein
MEPTALRTTPPRRLSPAIDRPNDRWTSNEEQRLLKRFNTQAADWVARTLTNNDPSVATVFFDLPKKAQILAVQLLATSARASLSLSEIDPVDFICALTHEWTDWISPESPTGRLD